MNLILTSMMKIKGIGIDNNKNFDRRARKRNDQSDDDSNKEGN